jgi:hypothetical protein
MSVPLEETLGLVRVTLVLCTGCLAGKGGECHTPGCSLWMNRGPDIPIVDSCEEFKPLTEWKDA